MATYEYSRSIGMQFHITELCNLFCVHCYKGESKKESSLKKKIKICDNYFQAVKKLNAKFSLGLCGGEPFMSNHFWDILDYVSSNYDLKEKNLVVIGSNGTLITKNTVKRLSKYGALDSVQVSLDGAKTNTHDMLRGKGSYARALKGIQNLANEHIPFSIHYVVHKLNYREAFLIPQVAKKLGAHGLTVSRLVPIGHGRQLLKYMLSSHELKTLLEALHKKEIILSVERFEEKTKMRILVNRCDWLPISTDIARIPAQFEQNRPHCLIGHFSTTIMADGTVYPCSRLRIPIGNILEQDFLDIWNHELLNKFRSRKIYIKGKCNYCQFCVDPQYNHLCGGGAACISYAFYNDPFKSDPQCWHQPQRRLYTCPENI
jgi:radical SAM protein with 4Fe4S-binding SPASM domain